MGIEDRERIEKAAIRTTRRRYGYNSFAERVRNGYIAKGWGLNMLYRSGFYVPWIFSNGQGWFRNNKKKHLRAANTYIKDFDEKMAQIGGNN